MTDKEGIIIDGANILKEKINMCFILLLNKLETTETIERTIYEHLDAFVDEWNDLFQHKEQECEELKNEYWKLEQDNDFLAEKNSRLKGCLAEIKEIAEPFCNACQEFEPEKKGSNCMYCNYGIILRKISEVEK